MHKDLSFSFCFPFGKLSESVLRWLVRSVLLFICVIPTLGTAATSDLSGDGKSDLIFRNNSTGEINAWLMNGGVATSTAQLLGPGNWTVTHTGDFNGDGKADILLRNDDGSVALWLMNGTTLISGAGLLGPNSGWSVTHVADFNGDGKADILFSHTDGRVAMWLMNGSTLVSGAGLLEAASGWSVTHIGDFNGDGKADILFRHADGRIAMWLMNGLTLTSGAGLLEATSGWSVTHTGDFNGDGKSDILFRHTDGRVAMWLMNGLTLTSGAGLLADPNWSVSHVGDFNGDGKTDILWRNTNGAVIIWLMNGLSNIGTVGLLGADQNWRVTHIGDYNGDGRADVVWRNNADGSIRMWLIDGATVLSQTSILGASPWVVVPQVTITPQISGGSINSTYSSMASDVSVSSGTSTLITTTIFVPYSSWVYTQSDGRYGPLGSSQANAYIEINGVKISNDSLIDWRNSNDKQQHSFNVIGAKYLQAGSHTVTLKGTTVGAGSYFGAGTNLSVLVDAATTIVSSALTADSAVLSFDTNNTPEGTALPPVGKQTILSNGISNLGGPIIAFASGHSDVAAPSYGDAMWGIFLNGSEPNIDSMTWSINDLWTGAETKAPMFSQGLFNASAGTNTISLVASESPYYPAVNGALNNVAYRVGATSALVTLHGGITVFGKALSSQFSYAANGQNRRYAYNCIATDGFNSSCPLTGTEVVLGEGSVCIPAAHNGVVMFSAKTRIQGGDTDSGGTVFLQIKIDGNNVGNVGVQQLGRAPNAVSTRTFSASYLAAGNNRLTPGCHSVKVTGQASGGYKNLSLNFDMPLIWFD